MRYVAKRKSSKFEAWTYLACIWLSQQLVFTTIMILITAIERLSPVVTATVWCGSTHFRVKGRVLRVVQRGEHIIEPQLLEVCQKTSGHYNGQTPNQSTDNIFGGLNQSMRCQFMTSEEHEWTCSWNCFPTILT